MTFDHFWPRAEDGKTSFENLCLACRSCNEFKSNTTEAVDTVTGESTRFSTHVSTTGPLIFNGVLMVQQ
jgi:5-methylcytosine-specific restriction endonuclease McrA